MSNLITMNVTGRIGREPKLKTTAGGSSVLNFSVASSRSVKKESGDYHDETIWFDVAVWGARADGLAKVLAKGDLVSVSGSFWPRTFQRRAGGEGTAFELQAHVVHREMKAREGREQKPRSGSQGDDQYESSNDDDSIPF
jgi:single-strand DNA-binding protein